MSRYFVYPSQPAVKSVTVIADQTVGVSMVRLVLDDTDETFVEYLLGFDYPSASSDEAKDLYAMGFVDANRTGSDPPGPLVNSDGDTVEIEVAYWKFGTTRDSLAENGAYDPFDRDSFLAWRSHFKMRGSEVLHPPTIETDSVSGRTDVKRSAGTVPSKFAPPSQQMTQSLADVDVYLLTLSTGKRVVLSLTAPAGTPYEQGEELNQDQRMRGLIQWFIDKLTSNGTIITDGLPNIDGLDEVTLTGLTFQFDQDIASGVTDNLAFDVVQFDSAGSTPVSTITFQLRPISPSDDDDIELEKIRAYFAQLTVTVDTAENEAADVPPFGSTKIPVTGERLRLSEHEVLDEQDAPIWKDRHSSERLVMSSGVGKTVAFADLAAVSGQTYKFVPLIIERTAIHNPGTTAAVIRVPVGSKCLPTQGKDGEFEVHHLGATGSTEIQDKDGNHIHTVEAGEHAVMRVAWLVGGDTEVRSIGEVVRTYELVGTAAGNLATKAYLQDPGGDGDYKVRLWGLPSLTTRSVDKFHADTFSRAGTAGWSNNQQISAGFDPPEAVKMLKAGRIRVEFEAVVEPAASGAMPDNNALLIIVNGSREGPLFFQGGWAANGPSQTYHAVLEFDVAVDDKLIPLFRYLTSGLTMSLGDVDIDYYRLRLDLARRIQETF